MMGGTLEVRSSGGGIGILFTLSLDYAVRKHTEAAGQDIREEPV